MRAQQELKNKEFQEDLFSLYCLLIDKKIPCKIQLHPIAEKEPKVKELIGFFPAGTHQILIKKNGTTYSVIRGFISFGFYEIMNIGEKGKKFRNPERFVTPEDLIKALRYGRKH